MRVPPTLGCLLLSLRLAPFLCLPDFPLFPGSLSVSFIVLFEDEGTEQVDEGERGKFLMHRLRVHLLHLDGLSRACFLAVP